MKNTILTVGAVLCLLIIARSSSAGVETAPPAEVQSAWRALKALAGEWEGQAGEQGNHRAHVSYRVVSGGSVVMETLFPGTDHEMISMYHMDKDKLVMTHYCSAGNQPSFMLDPRTSKDGQLVFRFNGGGNLDVEKDGHIHAGRMKIADKDHVESEWDFYKNGELDHSMKFTLARVGAAK